MSYSGAGWPIASGRWGSHGSLTMLWLTVSVMPHQPTVRTPNRSVHCGTMAPAPNQRYECRSGASMPSTARMDRPMSDVQVHPYRTDTSQNRLVDHFGSSTARPPHHIVGSSEY